MPFSGALQLHQHQADQGQPGDALVEREGGGRDHHQGDQADSSTDDNQQSKRDASNMYVVMGFYIASI